MKTAPKSATDTKQLQEQSQAFMCPFCESGVVSGIYLFPLRLDDLEEAVALKKASPAPVTSNGMSGDKRKRDDGPVTQDEMSYNVYSRLRTGSRSMLGDSDQHRTGRWTDIEMAYVDHLVTTFDEGKLPVAEGVKLNTFLCDLLLCKSSRLTKKMKNAKLSTRTFKAAPPAQVIVNQEDCQILSALQETFLTGQSTETAQLELRFNVTRQWRAYFSNFCMQAGYLLLDAKDWISSIDELEGRAIAAEEKVRKTRRKHMSKALSIQPANDVLNKQSPTMSTVNHQFDSSALTSSLAHMESEQATRRGRSFSDDFEYVLQDLAHGSGAADSAPVLVATLSSHPAMHATNALPTTFLDALQMMIESPKSPYQHADIWVPSLSHNDDDGENVQLLHAGYVSRRDQPQGSFSMLNEFGEYSKSFTFLPGDGLPGRVYNSGEAAWDFNLFKLDPNHFARSKGASMYGIKTATGIPVNTRGVGRMVVVLYSCNDLVEDSSLTKKFAAELTKYSPQPKWKLVIDINEDAKRTIASPQESPHFQPVTHEQPLKQSFNNAGVVSPVSTINDFHRSTNFNDIPRDDIEQELINLLGNEPANFHNMAVNNFSSASDPCKLVPHSMEIRLLLLRPSSRRSSEENELIEVLKSSFVAYTKSNTRRSSDLAKLLVRDWVCMKSVADPHGPGSKEMPQPTVSHGHGGKMLQSVAGKPMFKASPISSMGPLDAPLLQLQRRVSTVQNG